MKQIWGVFIAVLISWTSFGQKTELGTNAFDMAGKPVISVYPNPASEFISVRAESTDLRSARFVLYTIIGNVVQVEPEFPESDEVRIRIKDLPSGYYLLAIRMEETGFKTTRKFLKR